MSIKIKISIIAICFALVAAVCIGFVFASPNETVNMNGMINYEVKKTTITVQPNYDTLGSTTGSGEYVIGTPVTLNASIKPGSEFLGWATSTDVNNMEILSTSQFYSFYLEEDSPTTYYALFNSTTTTRQTVGDLVYTFYNEAKLASVTGPTSTSVSGNISIPSTVSRSGNTYKVFKIGSSAFEDYSSLTDVTIPEGVVIIDYNAFASCSSLNSISIPSTIIVVEPSAFSWSDNLTYYLDDFGNKYLGNSTSNFSVFFEVCNTDIETTTIDPNCKVIYGAAFIGCRNLKSISIPEGVKHLGMQAFDSCDNLENINIPLSLTSIDQFAFPRNANLNYNLDEQGNKYLGNPINDYFIFISAANDNMTNLEIESGCKIIYANALENNSNLETLKLPSSLEIIGDFAFAGTNLKSVVIPASVSMMDNAFEDCNSLKTITFEENSQLTNLDLRNIGAEFISVPESVLHFSLGGDSVIELQINGNLRSSDISCPNVTRVIIGENVSSILYDFLSTNSFPSLKEINVHESNNYYKDDKDCALLTKDGTELLKYALSNPSTLYIIPDGVALIEDFAFMDSNNLKSVVLPSSVTSIGYSAFNGCSSLTSITIPERVTSIGSFAFNGCSSLTSITINGNISTLDSYAFSGCSNLTKLTLGSNVTSLPDNLFGVSYDNLTELTEIVVEAGSSLSAALPIYGIWFKDGVTVRSFSGAGTYSTTQPTIITVEANQASLGSVSGGGTFDLGDTVTLTATRSGSNSFLAWATSTDPDTMEILSTSTTYSFELAEDSPTTYYALFNSTTTTEQTFEDLIYTFYNEAKLAMITDTTSTSVPSGDFTIPSVVSSGENSYKVYSIGYSAFQSCSRLTSVTIQSGVTRIAASAFRSCSRLVSITLPESLTEIGDSAFESCRSLTAINLPSGITLIGDRAFALCTGLKEFGGEGNSYYSIIDNSALIIDGGRALWAYAVAATNTTFSVPMGVTEIGSHVFYQSQLTDIMVPQGITIIGDQAFAGCTGLRELALPEGLTSIGASCFLSCTNLESIILPETLTKISNNAFQNCVSLESIILPNSIRTVNGQAFYLCSGLKEIKICGNITTFRTTVFSDCPNIEKLVISSNVTALPSSLFTNVNLINLTEIVVEEGSTLSAELPTYGTWHKDGVAVTSFTGAGTYTKS